MIRILIADDHEIVRKGLKLILLGEFAFAHIEEAEDGEKLVEKALTGAWDIIISDIAMPGTNGMEALKQIKEKFPQVPVLMLSIHSEEQYAPRVLKAGASGYLSKDVATKELVLAVNTILRGRRYISPSMSGRINENAQQADSAPHDSLSRREFDVFKMLAAGKPLTDIAETLHLGVTTVSTYRSRILEKMHLKSNADLTRYAIEYKLLSFFIIHLSSSFFL